jgi:chromate transporter
MIALAALAFVAIFFFDVPFPLIMLAAGLIGFVGRAPARPPSRSAAARRRRRKALADADSLLGEELPEHARPTVARALAGIGGLARAVARAGDRARSRRSARHTSSARSPVLLKMAVVTFGGAYAVLAYVAQQAVETYGWLRPGEMLDGLGMAETTPGPLIMVLQFVGFMAAFRDPGALPPMLAGTLGGLLATWVTFTPCFLWIFLGAPFIERCAATSR